MDESPLELLEPFIDRARESGPIEFACILCDGPLLFPHFNALLRHVQTAHPLTLAAMVGGTAAIRYELVRSAGSP